ncbi:ribonuclease H-like domain-containing protein [Tanacetum coccineum]|uniref:Ribonuclease H-like domain-containing protein n=1 Tax=Tanacetum coccineum TaxID=301880 RepID=A0ABQ5FFV2_9ASTR
MGSAHIMTTAQPTQPESSGPTGQPAILLTAFTTGTLHDPTIVAWNMDTGASSHLNNSVNSLNAVFNTCMYPSISVGDGHSIPVTNTGHSILLTPTKSLHLNNVLITFIFTGDLYPVTAPSPIPHVFLKPPVLCHACQLGKHVRLPFVRSDTVVTSCFDIIHTDVSTSPIPSLSGYIYYVLFLDHYSQFVWVYPLINKSDVMSRFMLFRNFVRTQFKCEIKSFQCDHGGEFDNRYLHTLFAENEILFRFSCPHTSQQNGKSERMVRTINNLIRTLLFQANLPPTFWVEAYNMATHLLNILPSTAIAHDIPYIEG